MNKRLSFPFLFCLFSSLTLGGCSSFPISVTKAKLNESEIENMTYEIYPTPHEITYLEGSFNISNKILNVYFDKGLDEATILKFNDIFYDNGILYRNDAKKEYDVRLSLVNDSKDLSYLFEKYDAYYLEINSSHIDIKAKDTDSLFYSLATLKEIIAQSNGILRNLIIKDYSDTKYRGFIEGYYGIPWSKDERVSLIKYASNYKANIYIYAPKDDSYHSTNWKGLYKEGDLALLKEVIKAGYLTKTRFAWSIHPFLHDPFKEENYDADLAYIKNKFYQLYEAGVRQFVISADDVSTEYEGAGNGKLHKRILNDVSTYLKTLEGTYDLIFVPSAYCYNSKEILGVELEGYYQDLCNGLDESVSIMWTGDRVTSTINNGKFNEFSSVSGGRKPFFWMNWPVNDYAKSHVLMGKGEVYNKNYFSSDEVEFIGLVTNPMQEAEPSKLGIFATADYSWNTKDFDMDKSYQYSFKTVENNQTSGLEAMCSYLTNASLYEGKYFVESPKLVSLIDEFMKQVNSLNKDDSTYLNLLNQLNEDYELGNKYLINASNIILKDTLSPWINSVLIKLKAAINSVNLYVNRSEYSVNEFENKVNAINDDYTKVNECKTPTLDVITQNIVETKVDSAVTVLTPFVEKMISLINDENDINTGKPSGIKYYGFNGIYEGSIDNIIDGDDSTYCWFNDTPSSDAYLRYDLGEVKEINDISVHFANANGDGDIFFSKVYASIDGRNYSLIGETNKTLSIIDLRQSPLKARYIKFVNNNTETWASFEEIKINSLPELKALATLSGIALEPSVSTSLDYMFDGDLSTFTWFEINKNATCSITIDFLKEQNVNNIVCYMTKTSSPYDMFYDVSFFYSLDGETYQSVGEKNYKDSKEIVIDLSSSPLKARYIKLVSNSSSPYGVVIREFNINQNF